MRARVIPEVEDIVAACVDRLERGQSTVEECLAAYPPEVTAQLEPMLRVAERLTQFDAGTMDADALLRVEAQLLARADALQAKTQPSRSRSWAGLFARVAAVAMIITVVIALGGGGFLAVSANSLPGSPLYPVKRASETLQLGLTRDPGRQATLHTTFGLRRLQEAVQLNRQLKRWDPSTLKDMEHEFAQAAGQANAKVVWEHIAAAAASGERELAENDGEDDLARTAAEALRRVHTRADQELDPDGEQDSQQPTSTPSSVRQVDRPTVDTGTATYSPTEAPTLAPTRAVSGQTREDEAESRPNLRVAPPKSTVLSAGSSHIESSPGEGEPATARTEALDDDEHPAMASSEDRAADRPQSNSPASIEGDKGGGDELRSASDQNDSGGRDELKLAGGEHDSSADKGSGDDHGGGDRDGDDHASGGSEGGESHADGDD